MAGFAALLVTVVFAGLSTSAQSGDATRVLAEMRQALGGDAAIAAIRTFSVDGSESSNFGNGSSTAGVAFYAELPDKFVKVRRTSAPFVGDYVHASGFNGDARVSRQVSNIPGPPDPYDATPALRAEGDRRAVLHGKQEFARLAVALIGLAAVYPVDSAYESRQTLDGRGVDVLRLTAPDGYTARLFVDSATHLPTMISWMSPPHVVIRRRSFAPPPMATAIR